MAEEFEAPWYVCDGQTVYIRWSRTDRTLLKCKVACACGNTARVVNEKSGFNKWVSLDALLVPTEEVARRIMES
jgi:hypothetical protein